MAFDKNISESSKMTVNKFILAKILTLHASRNIEVSVIVIDQTGKIVENCIYYSARKGHGQSRSTLPILYHNNSPIWNETLRLQASNKNISFPSFVN